MFVLSLDMYGGCIKKQSYEQFPLFYLYPSSSVASPDRNLNCMIFEKRMIKSWLVFDMGHNCDHLGSVLGIYVQHVVSVGNLCFLAYIYIAIGYPDSLRLNTSSQGGTTAHKVIDFKTKTENPTTPFLVF
jgi:hypothetical protein